MPKSDGKWKGRKKERELVWKIKKWRLLGWIESNMILSVTNDSFIIFNIILANSFYY